MADMTDEDTHRKLIGNYLHDLPNIGYKLTQRERAMLNKYGAWMEALIDGSISPITPEQVRFIEVAKGLVKPKTEFEKAWINVAKARLAISNARKTPVRDVYTHRSSPSVKVCPQCGMVGSNCTCGRSWY